MSEDDGELTDLLDGHGCRQQHNPDPEWTWTELGNICIGVYFGAPARSEIKL